MIITFANEDILPTALCHDLPPLNEITLDQPVEELTDLIQAVGATSVVSALASIYERRLIAADRWPIMSVPRYFDGPIIYTVHYSDDPLCVQTLKYIGSSKVGDRPWEHRTKLHQARRINEHRAYLQAIHCPDAAMAKLVEETLISHYSPEWNKTGFGHRPRTDKRERKRNPWAVKYDFWYSAAVVG